MDNHVSKDKLCVTLSLYRETTEEGTEYYGKYATKEAAREDERSACLHRKSVESKQEIIHVPMSRQYESRLAEENRNTLE